MAGAALALLGGAPARAASARVRVVMDAGLENRTMLTLLQRGRYLEALGVRQELLVVDKPALTIQALARGQADLCLLSAANSVVPAIAKGAPLRIVGAAMQRVALTFYASDPRLCRVVDLAGQRIGVGPCNGLLAVLVRALLARHGLRPEHVTLVDCGSNAQVFAALKAGQVAAGLADIADAAAAQSAGLRRLRDGDVWRALPDYPYQLSYASQTALTGNRQGVVLALAAYGRLYRALGRPGFWPAYAAAREAAGADAGNAEAMWDFIQTVQPYSGSPVVSAAQLAALQAVNVSQGLQTTLVSLAQLADLTVGETARALI